MSHSRVRQLSHCRASTLAQTRSAGVAFALAMLPHIQRAFRTGAMTYRQVAARLNECGVATGSARRWDAAFVRKVARRAEDAARGGAARAKAGGLAA